MNSAKILLLTLVAFCSSACSDSTEYRKHFWPGPIQVFESADSLRLFIQFDQVFSPVSKERLWDHPTGRKRGAKLWVIDISKKNDSGKVRFFGSRKTADVVYGVSFHPNLGGIFEFGGTWYLWRGRSYRTDATLSRLDEEELVFDKVENEAGPFFERLLSVEKDNEAHVLLGEYNKTADFPLIYADMTVSSRAIGESLVLEVQRGDDGYHLTVSWRGKGTENVEVRIDVEDESEIVTEDYIDSLPKDW